CARDTATIVGATAMGIYYFAYW
nr:immunoglobulin heavy chain junction region [Macaca mulatta]MOV42562.1 immunoglobulin heavy chain junction region [Macaca mulatta]MOV42702.1 immunoglobulin heavy chain junction region [Macaca mulatta]MOV47341.1 immunoglobulin heavy chain junction region [Macaca mulatta]